MVVTDVGRSTVPLLILTRSTFATGYFTTPDAETPPMTEGAARRSLIGKAERDGLLRACLGSQLDTCDELGGEDVV